jgi:hypothetical protein
MIFNGTFSYLIRNTDLYGLSRYNHKHLTDENFTILASIKPNFDIDLNKNEPRTGYVVCKNGLHIGIYFMKTITENENLYQIGCSYCTTRNGIDSFNYINIDIEKSDNIYNVAMVHHKNDKSITLYVNNEKKTITYEDELVDYSNSWLWVGAACGMDEYDERYSYFYQGDIQYIGIFKESINEDILLDILFLNKILNYDSKHSPVFITNFSEYTQFKIKDQSNNGNHLVKYNNEWI